jgi:hypothetical protein
LKVSFTAIKKLKNGLRAMKLFYLPLAWVGEEPFRD